VGVVSTDDILSAAAESHAAVVAIANEKACRILPMHVFDVSTSVRRTDREGIADSCL